MTQTYRSFAKINLHLEVLGRRDDGYHELVTVFQSIDFYDLLTVELRGRNVDLEVVRGNVPTGAGNLAAQAAQVFLDRWAPGIGVRLVLDKRVPLGGGLGGGSSNAATVLLALQDLLASPAPPAELCRVAASLGADVPYFLVGGTALGKGRGDEVEALPDLPEEAVTLVIPKTSISTAEVFASIDQLTAHSRRSSICALIGGEYTGSLADLDGWNDLQAIVLNKYPEVARAYSAVESHLSQTARLSGSGATLFLVPASKLEADDLAARLPTGCRVVTTRSLSRKSLQDLRTVH